MFTIWKKKIIDLYILKELAYPFIIGIMIITIIMLSNYLFQLTDLIIVKNVPIKLVLKLLFYYLPEIIVETFPMAILFATITGMGRLSRENEFTALRMGGISLPRLLLPLIIMGIIISGLTFVLNENIVPWSSHQARNIIRQTILQDAMPDIQENVFFQGPKGRIFFVESYRENTSKLSNIMIYYRDKDKKGDFPPVITAKKGSIKENTWLLSDGIIHEYDKDGYLSMESHFDQMEIEVTQESKQFFGEQRTTSEMSRRELKEEIDLFKNSGINVSSLYVDYHLKLARPLAALLFILIGTPLSLTRKENRIASILMTISIIFFYYLMLSINRSLGRNGYLPPLVAAWLPNILFAIVGIILIIWRESFTNIMHRLFPGLFAVILCLLLAVPGYTADDSLKIKGDHLDYNRETGLVEIVKNVNGHYRNYYFQADKITVKLKDGSEQTFSPPEEIKMSPGKFSGCNYEQPHYFFSAQKISIYPDDYLEAYHVIFKELNGQLPLFYWPYLYISLKDEKQKVEPEFGYDTKRGWFVKTTWNYKYDKYPGEYYFDYYTKSTSAGGLKQYFLYTPLHKAYLYYYEQNDNGIPGLFDKEGILSYELDYKNWQFQSDLNYTDYDDRVIVRGIANGSHILDNQDIYLDTEYEMTNYKDSTDRDREIIDMSAAYIRNFSNDLNIFFDYDMYTYNYLFSDDRDDKEIDMKFEMDKRFENNLAVNLKLAKELDIEPIKENTKKDEMEIGINYNWAKYWEMKLNYNYGKKNEPDYPLKTRWGGKGAISRKIGDFTAEVVLERDDPGFSEEEADDVRFFRWPEFNLYYQPHSPFSAKIQAGRYYEDKSGREGYRGNLEGNYYKSFHLSPTTSLKTEHTISTYFYNPIIYPVPGDSFDNTQLAYKGETVVVNRITDHLKMENKYIYNDYRGKSLFNFDQQERKELLEAVLKYTDNKFEFIFTGGYNLYLEKYLLLGGTVKYSPLPEWEISMSTEYDPNTSLFDESMKFSSLFKGEKLSARTEIDYDINNAQTEILKNKLVYELKGDWGWYLENNVTYDYDKPQGEKLKEANILLKKKLHCRELSFSYNYLDNEFLVTYTIDLIPGKGITVGRDENNPLLINIGDKSLAK